MKRNFSVLLSLLMLASLTLAACGGGATPKPETEAPVAFAPMKTEAPKCDAGNIKSIESVSESVVKITLCNPDPGFPSKIALANFGIQPAEYIEAQGGAGDLLTKPIGTGAYMLDTWERGSQIIFKANPNYWGAKAKSETLVFMWNKEAAARLLALQAGTVDAIDNLGPGDFAKVKDDKNLQLVNREPLNIFYIGFNNNPNVTGFDNSTNPLANEKVRQAIAMGIDRQRIVTNFYSEGSSVADYFTPCVIPNGCVGEKWYGFDAAAAKALLAEAGYPDGFETTLSYRDVVRGYLPYPPNVATDIQTQLKENLNITATIDVMESGAYTAAAAAGELKGIYLFGWGADYPDATNFLDYHFGSGATDQFGDKFKDVTDALASAAQLADEAERKPFYETANNAIRTHVPMIPVAYGASAVVYKASVTGAHASPLSIENFAAVSNGSDTFVWMQNAEPVSLYCADEEDGESLRACLQVTEPLLGYQVGLAEVVPALAETYDHNTELTEWTFNLRQGVTFHDGSAFDANDVVVSLVAQWDAASPLHKGNSGSFSYWTSIFGGFLNAK